MCKAVAYTIFIYKLVYTSVYTHKMADIYDTTLLCDECKTQLQKSFTIKNGFKMRSWHCPKCNKQWIHPKDEEEYKQYIELKRREFEVKLRQVGNSWSVSIPKEVIRFEEVTKTEIVRMSMDEPGKLTIFFSKIRRIR